MYLGSNSEFVGKVIRNPTSNMGYWYENTDTALYHRSLDDAIHLVCIGFLGFSGKFVDPDTIKREINKRLEEIGYINRFVQVTELYEFASNSYQRRKSHMNMGMAKCKVLNVVYPVQIGE